MSDPLSKSVSDVLALHKETQEVTDPSPQSPTVEALRELVPTRIRLSRQLLKSYLSTAEDRAKLFKSMVKPIRTLLDHSEITPMAAEHFICLITDILLHCDGTEVFDRALLESNIRDLSQYVANPEFEDGIEASSKEIPIPTFTRV